MAEKKWGIGVDVEVHDNVVVIAHDVLERRNAMSPQIGEAMAEAIDHYLSQESVRALVLTGRWEHFSAGGDIQSMHSSEGLSAEAGFRSMADFECVAQGVAFSSAYHRDAVERFSNKRDPQFVWSGVSRDPYAKTILA